MGKQLKVLLVEDNPYDADIISNELELSGYSLAKTVVANRQDFTCVLDQSYDIIIADYFLADFSGSDALDCVVKAGIKTPFIIVSGSIREDIAIECMKKGAADYLFKDRLMRLGSAVDQAIERALFKARSDEERSQLLEAERKARIRAQELQQEADQANILKDEFLANVSHELRTPLSAIVGWLELILSGGVPSSELFSTLGIVKRNAVDQLRIVEDLLDVSRIITGKLTLNVDLINISDLVLGVVETFRLIAHGKNIDLKVLGADGPLPHFMGDRARLRQILNNLLGNALKFTPHGGAVQVAIEVCQGHLKLSIRDDGQGISKDFLPFIFQSFRQADGSKSRVHGGLGIGLTVAKKFVELHGGEIVAESEGPNKGSLFTVMLPIASEKKPVLQDFAPKGTGAAISEQTNLLDHFKILVIDDSDDCRLLFSTMLSIAGARTFSAPSGKEALKMLNESDADLVICDIGMPEMDGYAFMQKVRSSYHARYQKIPAIALTGYTSESDHASAISAGFNAHLSKPIKQDDLIGTVLMVCRKLNQWPKAYCHPQALPRVAPASFLPELTS